MTTAAPVCVGDAWNVSRDEEKQPANARGAKAETEHAATPCQQHALREQLADNPSAIGTHRRTDGQLALTPCRPREQQVGDVRTRDQEHERHGAEQHQQRRPHLTGCRIPHRHDRNAFLRVHPLGVGFAKLLADDLHLRLRARNGHAWLQPPGDIEVVALIGTVRLRLQRKPDVRFGVRLKAPREDADDCVGHAVQQDWPPEHLVGAAEAGLRHGITDHGHGRAVRQILALREGATRDWRNAEDLEVVRGDVETLHRLGRIARAHVHRKSPEIVQRHGVEDIVLPPRHVLGDGIRIADAGAKLAAELHDSVGLRVRQRLEEDSIHDREDRCVGADAEGQRRQSNGGEAEVPAHRAQGVAQIGEERFHLGRRRDRSYLVPSRSRMLQRPAASNGPYWKTARRRRCDFSWGIPASGCEKGRGRPRPPSPGVVSRD